MEDDRQSRGWWRLKMPGDEKDTSLQGQTGAHGGMSATIQQGLTVTKQLNVLMKNLYKSVPDTNWLPG